MKKIQPFTIGTKLSVPTGAKCQNFVDINLPTPRLDDCKLKSHLNDQMFFYHDQEQLTKHDPTAKEDCPEEEKDFLYASASSRSIKKIAICGSTETERDTCLTMYETDQRHNSTGESPPEIEPWRTMKNPHYDYGIPAFPLENASHSQQRDLKDFENSLIQLTSLDLKKDKPEGTGLKKPSTAGLCMEVQRRRHSIGERIDKLRLKFKSLLQDNQQDLMLALDVSSFYQQADIILSKINSKRSSFHVPNVQAGVKEKESREIASQIKMLNESAPQLSNLHPTLASRVTRKQAEVKESWALLQDALQNQRAATSASTTSEPKYFVELEFPGVMGKHVKEEQNRLRESEDVPDLKNGSSVSECDVALLDVPVGPRTCFLDCDQTKEKLLNVLSTLTLHINQHLSCCAELSKDISDIETDITMLCDPELVGLEGLLKQQDDLEVDHCLIEGEVEDIEILVRQLQAPLTEQSDLIEEVQAVLQAWKEVGRNTAENRERLDKFKRLHDYFKNYLATVAWTESTRSCILSGSVAMQGETAEIDREIEHKLPEFNKLDTAGQGLMEKGNQLAEIIEERTDEVQSMLAWIQANWKTQREQLSQKKNIFENVDLVNNACITERTVMRSNERNQHLQNQNVSICVESLLDKQNIMSDNHPLIREPCYAQTSLGSSICLILSFDEQTSGISQVKKDPSSSEVRMQHLTGNNEIQSQQSSVNSNVILQQLPDVNNVSSLQGKETVISESTEQRKQLWKNMQTQQSQCNQLTNIQQSSFEPKHMQPSLPMFQMQPDVINQVLKEQSLGNIQKQGQQLPMEWNEKQWEQSPGIQIQIQGNQIMVQAPVNDKEQTKKNERPEISASSSLDQQQQSQTITQVHPQSSDNISEFHSRTYLVETNQLIDNDQINLPSPQKVIQSQNDSISQDKSQISSSLSEQHSARLRLESPERNQVKNQESTGTQQVQKQKSPSRSQAQFSLEHVGASEVTHTVSAYLHITDSPKVTDRTSEMFSTSGPSSPPLISDHLRLSGFLTPGFRSSTTSISFPAPLEQQMKRKESNQRRHASLDFVRSDNSLRPQSSMSPRCFRKRASTWPEGDGCGKKHLTNSGHQVFIKQHLSDAICTEESKPFNILRDTCQTLAESPKDLIKHICSDLSTLRFSPPQDFRVFNNSTADLQSSEKKQHPPPSSVLTASKSQPFQSLPDDSSNIPMNQILKTQQGTHSQGTMISTKELCHWEMDKEQDMEQHTSGEHTSEIKEPLTAIDHMHAATSSSLPCSTTSSCGHKCPSVHTRIQDLNGHIYNASKYMWWGCEANSGLFDVKQLPGWLTQSTLESDKSKRVVFCGERECTVCCSALEKQSPAAPLTEDGAEAPQPFYWQFQEEERELEDIWRGRMDELASDCALDRGSCQKTGLSLHINKGPVALSLHG